MGRNAKKRRSQRGCPPRKSTTPARATGARVLPDELVYDALSTSSPERFVQLVAQLVASPDAPASVERAALGAIERAWDLGWQPRDLVRVAGRVRDDADLRWLVAAIAAQARSYLDATVVDPGWRAQLAEVGALDPSASPVGFVGGPGDLASTAERLRQLRWLTTLRALPRVGPSPREWAAAGAAAGTGGSAAGPDDAVVTKVRALLAKAESTDYPAEAEALTAKAQELVTRHAIDRALLEPQPRDEPIATRVHLDEPYAAAKSLLLAQVASANGCSAVWTEPLGFATVFGYRDDVDTVELLHASLLVQATRAMTAAGRHAAPGARTRSRGFRRAFLFGFAHQIGERLREASARETAEADERAGGSLLPVLARRHEAVDAAVRTAFPGATTGRRHSVSDGAGWSAGRAAGQLASLGLDHQVAPHLAP